jgi:hypothetical protein
MTSWGTSLPIAPLEYRLTMTRPPGSSTKPVDCRYRGSGLTNVPVAAAIASASALWPDREFQAVLADQVLRGGFIIDR